MKHLAEPFDRMAATWREAVEEKNTGIFGDFGGYPVPEPGDADFLLATAILWRWSGRGPASPASRSKKPKNVFLFARLKRLFPGAKFIGIAGDPWDALASASDFFHERRGAVDDDATKIAMISSALPCARTMLALNDDCPSDCMIVTYERMSGNPLPIAAELFRFLGVLTTTPSPGMRIAHVVQGAVERPTRRRSAQRGVLRKGVRRRLALDLQRRDE